MEDNKVGLSIDTTMKRAYSQKEEILNAKPKIIKPEQDKPEPELPSPLLNTENYSKNLESLSMAQALLDKKLKSLQAMEISKRKSALLASVKPSLPLSSRLQKKAAQKSELASQTSTFKNKLNLPSSFKNEDEEEDSSSKQPCSSPCKAQSEAASKSSSFKTKDAKVIMEEQIDHLSDASNTSGRKSLLQKEITHDQLSPPKIKAKRATLSPRPDANFQKSMKEIAEKMCLCQKLGQNCWQMERYKLAVAFLKKDNKAIKQAANSTKLFMNLVIHDLRNPTSQIGFSIQYALDSMEMAHIMRQEYCTQFKTKVKAMLERLLKQIETLQNHERTQGATINKLEVENAQLRQRITALENDNQELTQRVEELSRAREVQQPSRAPASSVSQGQASRHIGTASSLSTNLLGHSPEGDNNYIIRKSRPQQRDSDIIASLFQSDFSFEKQMLQQHPPSIDLPTHDQNLLIKQKEKRIAKEIASRAGRRPQQLIQAEAKDQFTLMPSLQSPGDCYHQVGLTLKKLASQNREELRLKGDQLRKPSPPRVPLEPPRIPLEKIDGGGGIELENMSADSKATPPGACNQQAEVVDSSVSSTSSVSTPVMSEWEEVGSMLEVKLREMDMLTAEAIEMMESCKHSSVMLLNLINDLLDLAKQEKNTFSLNYRFFNLEDTIMQAFKTLEFLATKNKIKMAIECSEEDQPYFQSVFGDKNRFEQILVNFLSNSLKFSDPDTEVTVKLKPSIITLKELRKSKRGDLHLPKGEGEVLLNDLTMTITDRGQGISDEGLKHLFIDFESLKEHKNKNSRGTGLGLSICKKIINKMGGTVTVSSKVGQGTSFKINILCPCQLVRDGPPAHSSKQLFLSPRNRGGMGLTKSEGISGTNSVQSAAGSGKRSAPLNNFPYFGNSKLGKSFKEKKRGQPLTPVKIQIDGASSLQSSNVQVSSPFPDKIGSKSSGFQSLFNSLKLDKRRGSLGFVQPTRLIDSGLAGRTNAIRDHIMQTSTDGGHQKNLCKSIQSKLRVLVANDDPSVLLILTKLLKTLNVTDVSQAQNGLEAIHKAKENPYDLIIMDLNMPVKSGFEATTAIKEHFKEPLIMAASSQGDDHSSQSPVIVALSGSEFDQKLIEECEAAMFDDWFSHPLSKEVIQDEILDKIVLDKLLFIMADQHSGGDLGGGGLTDIADILTVNEKD